MKTKTQIIAAKILELIRRQAPGDEHELRRLAIQARNTGEITLADDADAIADAMEDSVYKQQTQREVSSSLKRAYTETAYSLHRLLEDLNRLQTTGKLPEDEDLTRSLSTAISSVQLACIFLPELAERIAKERGEK